jgi:hypothetical protein
MKRRRIISDRHLYWNIKGLGHFVVFFCLNYLRFMRFERYHFEQIVVPLRYHSWNGMFREGKSYFAQLSIPFGRAVGASSHRCPRARPPFRASIPHCRLRARASAWRYRRVAGWLRRKKPSRESRKRVLRVMRKRGLLVGGNRKATTQFEARVALTLTNLPKGRELARHADCWQKE